MNKPDKSKICSQYKRDGVVYTICQPTPIKFPDGSQIFVNTEQQLEFKPKITCGSTQNIEDVK